MGAGDLWQRFKLCIIIADMTYWNKSFFQEVVMGRRHVFIELSAEEVAQFCFQASKVRLQRVDLALKPLAVGAFAFPSHIKLYRTDAGLTLANRAFFLTTRR